MAAKLRITMPFAIAGLWGSVLDAAGIVRHVSRAFEVFVPRSRLLEAR
jgi:hypothetical protein